MSVSYCSYKIDRCRQLVDMEHFSLRIFKKMFFFCFMTKITDKLVFIQDVKTTEIFPLK